MVIQALVCYYMHNGISILQEVMPATSACQCVVFQLPVGPDKWSPGHAYHRDWVSSLVLYAAGVTAW